jgi:hypothetical protein
MSRRLEIELTSQRPDGSWTWRAAGARQPKGELDGGILFEGAKVGDVVRAEADFAIDGIEILSVLAPKAARREPERLEVIGSGREEPLVTTQLAPKRGRRDGDRRGPRREGDRGPRREGDRGPRRDRGERRDGEDRRPRGPRPAPVPERPRPKRLRPGRTHRAAVLAELPAEQRPVAEQVLRGGVPAVREAIAKQNAEAREQNRPELPADQVVAMAEQLLPRLRAAEWRDRAEAALRDLDVLDLRDLRSVVVASEGVARDEASRALVADLQAGLNRRVEEEHRLWIEDITANLDAGRFVRALRLSSRPPKAGTPVPAALSARLIADVSAGLTERTNQELWAAALDALAFSPVRQQVTPAGRPAEPSPDLLEAVRRVADRLPAVAELFGVSPAEASAARRRHKPGRGRGGRTQGGGAAPGGAGGGRGARPAAGGPAGDRPAARGAAPATPATPERATPEPSEDPVVPDAAAPAPSEDPVAGDALTAPVSHDPAAAEPAGGESAAPEPAGDGAATDPAPAEADAVVEVPTDAEPQPSEDPVAPAGDGPTPSEDPVAGDPLDGDPLDGD